MKKNTEKQRIMVQAYRDLVVRQLGMVYGVRVGDNCKKGWEDIIDKAKSELVPMSDVYDDLIKSERMVRGLVVEYKEGGRNIWEVHGHTLAGVKDEIRKISREVMWGFFESLIANLA